MGPNGMRYHVLGDVRVTHDGTSVALGGAQQRRLLAVLLTAPGEVVPLDRIVDALWDDPAPDGARRTVMSYVSRLRGALGADAVAMDGSGYRLDGADDLDATRFVDLVARARRSPPSEAVVLFDDALALWHGDAFGDLGSTWWAMPTAIALTEARLAAEDDRADTVLALGRVDDAIGDLERLAAEQPLRTRRVVLLARARAATGDDATALRVLHEHRERLADETGLDPPRALAELEAAILAGTASTPRVRGYQLLALLGEGAHGAVYRSVQPGLGREVAVKVVRSELADDPGFVSRFEHEALMVARLEHPHIAPLYDFWREPGGAFLVFRLFHRSLRQALEDDGPWPIERAAPLLEQVGAALGHAHRSGVVHRDVKPSNILLDADGRAYLGDFGIAVTDVDITGVAAPVDWVAAASLSSPYSPPEWSDRVGQDPRADQYSLAMVVKEVLVGTLGQQVGSLPDELHAVLDRASALLPDDRFGSVDELLAAWRRAVAGTTGATVIDVEADGTVARVNPYVGLRSFGEADQSHFHARSPLAERLAAGVLDRDVLAVVGASGSGKSSLVDAGIVPLLRRRGHFIASMVPGQHPMDRLRMALRGVARTEPADDSPLALAEAVDRSDRRRLIVVVDQFEEAWTVSDDAARTEFLEALRTLSGAAHVHLIVALRADFYDRPLDSPLGQAVADHTAAVVPLTATELREVIVRPAAAVGVQFEPALVTQLVNDVADRPAGLPLLQFALHELFERRVDGTVTLTAYDELGGVAGAIASRAEAVHRDLVPAAAAAARDLFTRLVVPGDGNEDTGRRVRRTSLPEATAAVADVFTQHRLLTADVEPTGREPTYELAHEALIRSWPRLGEWLDDSREERRVRQQVALAATAWDERGRQTADLYRGGRLDLALEHAGDQVAPQEPDGAFLQASVVERERVDAAERATRRRLRRRLTVTSIALVLAVVAAGLAFLQRRDAQRQSAATAVARVAATSQRLADTRTDVAALMAVAAADRKADTDTYGALLTAVYQDPTFLGDLWPRDTTPAFSIDPSGRWLWGTENPTRRQLTRIDLATRTEEHFDLPFTEYDDVSDVQAIDDHTVLLVPADSETRQVASEVVLVDFATSSVVARHEVGTAIAHIRLKPSGDMVVATTVGSAYEPSHVEVLSVPGLERIGLTVQPGPVVLPDPGFVWVGESAWVGELVAVGSTTGRIALWDPTNDRVVRRINDPPDPSIGQVAWTLQATADGTVLVGSDIAPDGSRGNGMMAFDVATGRPLWEGPNPDTNLQFTIDAARGVIIAKARTDSPKLIEIDLQNGFTGTTSRTIQHGTVCQLSIAPGTGRLYVSSCNQPSIAVWSTDGATPAGPSFAGPGFGTDSGTWSSDGRHLMVFPDEGLSYMVDTQDPSRRVLLDDWMGSNAWGFAVQGNEVLMFDPGSDRIERFTVDGTSLGAAPADIPDEIQTADVTPDGSLIAVAEQGTDLVLVLDADDGRVRWRVNTGAPFTLRLSLSPDGSRLFVSGRDEETDVYDLTSGQRIGQLGAAGSVRVSNDSTVVAAASFNGVVTIYDARTLQSVGYPLPGGEGFALDLQFSPDDRLLATLGIDAPARLWDMSSRLQVGPPIERSGGVAFAPDGSALAVTTDAGVIRIDLDPAALRREACAVANRELTDQEWQQLVGEAPTLLCASPTG